MHIRTGIAFGGLACTVILGFFVGTEIDLRFHDILPTRFYKNLVAFTIPPT